RAQHVLDRVEDGRMAHEVGQPRELQVRLLAQLAAEAATVRGLHGLEPPAALERFTGRQHANRKIEAVTSIALDRRGGQHLHDVRAHTAYSGSPLPSGDRSSSVTSRQPPAASK